MKYTTEKLETIATKLRDLPSVEKRHQAYTKQDAIGVLVKEIIALQKRGYSLVQIAEALRGEGLDIASSTLKTYLMRTKPERKAVGAKRSSTMVPVPPTASKEANRNTSTTPLPTKQVATKQTPAKPVSIKPSSFPTAGDTDDI